MMRNEGERLREALKAIPGRATATRRLAGVLAEIREARAQGVEWMVIADGLASIGITRDDGRPLAISTIANVLRKADGATAKRRPQQPEPKLVIPVKATPPPPAVAGMGATAADLALFDEVEAMLAAPTGQKPTPTIDEFLEEKRNGKSDS